jgi:hypothetical protein
MARVDIAPELLNRPEPQPKASEAEPIWPMVIDDMRARNEAGARKYGVPLQAHNGRDALVDSYQEALDLCVYLRQAIAERDDARKALAEIVAMETNAGKVCGTCMSRVGLASELIEIARRGLGEA